jgi:hypothetical protein
MGKRQHLAGFFVRRSLGDTNHGISNGARWLCASPRACIIGHQVPQGSEAITQTFLWEAWFLNTILQVPSARRQRTCLNPVRSRPRPKSKARRPAHRYRFSSADA